MLNIKYKMYLSEGFGAEYLTGFEDKGNGYFVRRWKGNYSVDCEIRLFVHSKEMIVLIFAQQTDENEVIVAQEKKSWWNFKELNKIDLSPLLDLMLKGVITLSDDDNYRERPKNTLLQGQ